MAAQNGKGNDDEKVGACRNDYTSADNPEPGSTRPRKLLPQLPPGAEQHQCTASRSPHMKHSANCGSYLMEYSMFTEYNLLQKQKLPGVYVIPSAKSPFFWTGVLFIRQGLYQEGVFKFSMSIPENYPDGECPRLVFSPPIFHPVINPENGELDVKRAFPKWRRNVNHIWQVLLHARRIFYKVDTTSPLNPEAAVLYDQDMELFKCKVIESLKLCKEQLYTCESDDPYSIRFSEWDEELHGKALAQMLRPKVNTDGQPQ